MPLRGIATAPLAVGIILVICAINVSESVSVSMLTDATSEKESKPMHTFQTFPHWFSVSLPSYPTIEEDLEVDVAIIGGGITGITTAYMLKRAGLRVALLEKDTLASGDTSHTTAHLTAVTDSRLSELVKSFGAEIAYETWDAGRAAIRFIEETVTELNIDCELKRVPGYLHSPTAQGSASSPASGGDFSAQLLMAEARLAQTMGFPAAYVEEAPIFKTPAVRFDDAARFHPRLYLKGLLETIAGAGSGVFERSEVQVFQDEPFLVKANGRSVRCGFVVIATQVPLTGNTNLASAVMLQSRLAPYSTYAVSARVRPGLLEEGLYWNTSDPYEYLRVDSGLDHDYVIFGGADHKTGQADRTSDHFDAVENALKRVVPEADIDTKWSGQVIESNDGLPLVGETARRQFVATGFGGNGMTFGTASARIIHDAILKLKNPWSKAFSTHRAHLKGGTLTYLRENFDYPYYLFRDRLKNPDGEDFADVKIGEAKILRINEKRVASFRDEAGTLHAVSAVCTHMGCIVHWNGAEKTWDCPCHGSRFTPSGAVIAGPAETPLEEFRLP